MTLLYIAAALLMVYVAGWFVLPITIWTDKVKAGANARNYPGLVLMRPGLPYPPAVWAQEFYEARRGWRLVFIAGPLMTFGNVFPKWDFWRRRQEIMGHEIEVWAESLLFGTSHAEKRAAEARSLSRNYPCFQDWDVPRIEDAMRAQSGKALRFVERHKDLILTQGAEK